MIMIADNKKTNSKGQPIIHLIIGMPFKHILRHFLAIIICNQWFDMA